MRLCALMLVATLALAADEPPLPVEANVEIGLDQRESDQLLTAVLTFLQARIHVLEKLSVSQAGAADLQAGEAAQQRYMQTLQALQKRHGVPVTCQKDQQQPAMNVWDFIARQWLCTK